MNAANRLLGSFAKWASVSAAAFLVALSLMDLVLSRFFYRGIAGSPRLIEHALLALAFFAAVSATVNGNHLALTGTLHRNEKARLAIEAGVGLVTLAFNTALFLASFSLLFIGFEPSDRLLGLPIAVFVSPMALGFFLMAASNIASAPAKARAFTLAGAGLGLFLGAPALLNVFGALGSQPAWLSAAAEASYATMSAAGWPLIAMLAVAAFMGLPLYVVLSGIATILFLRIGSSVELIPSEAYNLLRNETMPAIPLFTIAGFLLSESGAGKRLVGVFREWAGWVPGGEAFAAVLVCAFFTTFTGANGVTILALGSVLAFVLVGSGAYDEKFSHGLLTASSSVGLLFPPSLAIILYSINAQFLSQSDNVFTITDMFLGAIVPGALLTLSMGGAGVLKGMRKKGSRKAFDHRAAFKSLKDAAPELVLPLIIAILYFTGIAGLTEIGAVVILYLILVEGVWKKEFGVKTLFTTISKALPVAGGALIIIAAARGLSFYIMDAGIPEAFTAWMGANVASKALFLLLLNAGLLLVGCFMDIFSAVLVISPLVIPLAATYGVHPVHLGVIFIMNLSIGFLTPPIGMNLFLASYAFDKPVIRIYKDVLPFFLVQLGVLVLVTWVPWFSLVLLHR